MPLWRDIPLEIRQQVLEELARIPGRVAPFAAVCKEWQAVIEKTTFRQLTLRQSCLPELISILRQDRRFIKHVFFRVELRPPRCPTCGAHEGDAERVSRSVIGKKCIRDVVAILRARGGDRGLTLELGSQVPAVPMARSGGLVVPCTFASSKTSAVASSIFKDPFNGEFSGQRVHPLSEEWVARLRGSHDSNFSGGYEVSPIVTSLFVCMQPPRRLGLGFLPELVDSLPKLEELVFETWYRGGQDPAHLRQKCTSTNQSNTESTQANGQH